MDAAVAQLADRQHGVVALWQLMRLGLSARAVRSRVAAGRLHPLHRGVYAVGRPSVSVKGTWMAAVLACGDGALLSHRSAMALWGVGPQSRRPSDVTVPCQRRPRPGIRVHRSGTLHPDDVARVGNVPCTSTARTLLDYAETAGDRELRRAVEALERVRALDGRALEAVLGRAGGRRGAARIRAVLDAWTAPPFTRSEAERLLAEILHEAGLPKPMFNCWVAGYEVDAYWPEHGLVVEFDSWEFHRTRRAFEEDRIRDADLGDAGLRVRRVTWRQLGEPGTVVARLTRALSPPPPTAP